MLRLGIIGCGNRAFGHLFCLLELPYYEIAALCDSDEETLKSFYDTTSYYYKKKPVITTDYKELLKREDIDAVLISAPTYMHIEIALAALKYKKDILLEKPVGISIWETDVLIKKAKESDNIIDVCMPLHYSYILSAIYNLARKFGGTKYVVINEHRNPFMRPWFYDRSKSGGAINDKMIHYFDIANTLFNKKPIRVYASGFQHKCTENFSVLGTLLEEYKIDKSTIVDNASIIVEYSDNSQAVFTMNMYQKYPYEGHRLSLTGLSGDHLVATDFAGRAASISVTEEGAIKNYSLKDRSDMDVKALAHPGTKAQLVEFYNNVKERKESKTNLWISRTAQMISDAAEESIKSHHAIDLSRYDSAEIESIAKKKNWIIPFQAKEYELISSEEKKPLVRRLRIPGSYLLKILIRRRLRKVISILEKQEVVSKDVNESVALIFPWYTFVITSEQGKLRLTEKKQAYSAETKLIISEEGLLDLLRKKEPYKAYQEGKIKITGDIEKLRKYMGVFEQIYKNMKRR